MQTGLKTEKCKEIWTTLRVLPFGPSVFDETVRALRTGKRKRLPPGGRHADDLTWEHVALVLLGCFAPVTSKADEWIERYWELGVTKALPKWFSKARTFGDVFSRIVSDDINALKVQQVSVNMDFPEAVVTFDDGSAAIFQPHLTALQRHRSLVTRRVVFEPGVLHQLAVDLKQFTADGVDEWIAE